MCFLFLGRYFFCQQWLLHLNTIDSIPSGFESCSCGIVSPEYHINYYQCVKGKVQYWLSKTSVLTWCIVLTLCTSNKPVKIWAQLVIGVGRKWWKKKHPCWANLCGSDRNKRLNKSFIILVRNYLYISKSILLLREPFLTLFDTFNSSPMLVTESVFKLICFE